MSDAPPPVRVVRLTLPFSDVLALTLTFTLAGLLVGAALGIGWLIVRSLWGLLG